MTPNYKSLQRFLEPQNFVELISDGAKFVNEGFNLNPELCDFFKKTDSHGHIKLNFSCSNPNLEADLGKLPPIDKWGVYQSKTTESRWIVLSELLRCENDKLICLPIGERMSSRFIAICRELGHSEKAKFNKVSDLIEYFGRKRIFTEIFDQTYGYEGKLRRFLNSENVLELITLSRRVVLADWASYNELSVDEKIIVGSETYTVKPPNARYNLDNEVKYRLNAAQMHKIDPIDTPSGQSAGTIFSLPLHTTVDKTGQIKTGLENITQPKIVLDKIIFESQVEREKIKSLDDLREFLIENDRILYRCPKCETVHLFEEDSDDFECWECYEAVCEPIKSSADNTGYHSDASAIFGPCLSLVPFLNSNDGVRAQMGANALRHAIPASIGKHPTLKKKQMPIVRTGREEEIAEMFDGVSIDNLCPGNNLIVAFLPWYGWNFEDGIVISQEVIDNNLLSYQERKSQRIFYEPGEEPLDEKFVNELMKENGRSHKGIKQRNSYDSVCKKIALDTDGLPIEGTYIELNEDEVYGFKREREDLIPLKTNSAIRGLVSYQIVEDKEHDQEISVRLERPLAVGDKLVNRHGNKGVITKIEPAKRMPYFYRNGEKVRIQIILNPFGVVSRRNIGQILETNLGLCALLDNQPDQEQVVGDYPAGKAADEVKQVLLSHYDEWKSRINPTDQVKADVSDIDEKSITIGEDGYVSLVLPERDDNPATLAESVTIGYQYFLRLADHDADDKLSARSSGTQDDGKLAYNRTTGQPVAGRAQHGGQRFGEMETWALEGWSPDTLPLLNEILGIRSEKREKKINQSLFLPTRQLSVAEAWKQLFYDLLTPGIVLKLLDKDGKPLSWLRGKLEVDKVSRIRLQFLALQNPEVLEKWMVRNVNEAKITNPNLPKKSWRELFDKESKDNFQASLFSHELFCPKGSKPSELRLRARFNGIGYIELSHPILNPLAIRTWAKELKVSEWKLADLSAGLSPDFKRDNAKTWKLKELIDKHGENLKAIITKELEFSEQKYKSYFMRVIPVMPPVYRWAMRKKDRNGRDVLEHPAINIILRNIILANKKLSQIDEFERLANKLVSHKNGNENDRLSEQEVEKLSKLIPIFQKYRIRLEWFTFEWFRQNYQKTRKEGDKDVKVEIAQQFRDLEGESESTFEEVRAKLLRKLYHWCEKLILNEGDRKVYRKHHKPISARIFTKKGILRSSILGKRVDFSARAVISVNPELPLDKCGLPALAAIRMFREHVVSALEENKHKDAVSTLERLCELTPFAIEQFKRIAERSDKSKAVDFAKEVISDYQLACNTLEGLFADEEKELLVLLNRQPTLTRNGIHSFRPTLHHGATIQISPLVTGPFGADFDGDQMSCYPILMQENLSHAKKLLPTLSMKAVANGESVLNDGMDVCYGISEMDSKPNLAHWQKYFPAVTESGISAGVLDLILSDEKIPSETLHANPIYQIIAREAKGNWEHFKEIFGLNEDGNRLNDVESLSQGLSTKAQFDNCKRALKNVMKQALGTSVPGVLCRKLVLAARSSKLIEKDCGSEGIIIDTDKIDVSHEMLTGRFIQEINQDDGHWVKAESLSELPEKFRLRSPIKCKAESGLCSTCVGDNLANGKPWLIGSAIGMNAVLSISERMTQLIIDSAKHNTDFPIDNAKKYFSRPPKSIKGTIKGYGIFEGEVALIHFEVMLKLLEGKSLNVVVDRREDNILERMASLIKSTHQNSLVTLFSELIETDDRSLDDELSSATSALMMLKLKEG